MSSWAPKNGRSTCCEGAVRRCPFGSVLSDGVVRCGWFFVSTGSTVQRYKPVVSYLVVPLLYGGQLSLPIRLSLLRNAKSGRRKDERSPAEEPKMH